MRIRSLDVRKLTLATVVLGAAAFGAALPTAAQTVGQKPAATMSPDKKAKSTECSLAADKQGLHGKQRKAFRSKCKRGES